MTIIQKNDSSEKLLSPEIYISLSGMMLALILGYGLELELRLVSRLHPCTTRPRPRGPAVSGDETETFKNTSQDRLKTETTSLTKSELMDIIGR